MITKIRNLIKKLRKKAKPLYRSGWGLADNSSNNLQINVPNTAQWGTFQDNSIVISSGETTVDGVGGGTAVADTRVLKKPVEVVKELVSETPKMDMVDIGRQIKIVKRSIKILQEQYINPVDELEALTYLEARKSFKRYGKMFNWSVTNQELVDKLCKDYKIQLVSFNNFYKTVPNEALDELEKFNDAWEYVSEEKPDFKLITDQGGPEDVKDPILLAKSPFGRWYYILGAWDKEVEIVDDLIYKGK